MFKPYTQVNYITDANMTYFMRNHFNTDLVFNSVSQYELAVNLGFNKILWERKNGHSVYILEEPASDIEGTDTINTIKAKEKKELIAWWNRYLNI